MAKKKIKTYRATGAAAEGSGGKKKSRRSYRTIRKKTTHSKRTMTAASNGDIRRVFNKLLKPNRLKLVDVPQKKGKTQRGKKR